MQDTFLANESGAFPDKWLKRANFNLERSNMAELEKALAAGFRGGALVCEWRFWRAVGTSSYVSGVTFVLN